MSVLIVLSSRGRHCTGMFWLEECAKHFPCFHAFHFPVFLSRPTYLNRWIHNLYVSYLNKKATCKKWFQISNQILNMKTAGQQQKVALLFWLLLWVKAKDSIISKLPIPY